MISQTAKRRRRRTKKNTPIIINSSLSVAVTAPAAALSTSPRLPSSSKIKKTKPKISNEYRQEENEIKNALSVRFEPQKTTTETNEQEQTNQLKPNIEDEINFFTNSVHVDFLKQSLKNIGPISSPTKTIDSQTTVSQNPEHINKIDEIIHDDTDNDVDGDNEGAQPQLVSSSSFILIDSPNLIKKWQKHLIHYEDDILFMKSDLKDLTFPIIINDAEQPPQPTTCVSNQDCDSDGLFIPIKPTISNRKNELKMIKRFIENGTATELCQPIITTDNKSYTWEMLDVRKFNHNNDEKLYKTKCDKIFTPIKYRSEFLDTKKSPHYHSHQLTLPQPRTLKLFLLDLILLKNNIDSKLPLESSNLKKQSSKNEIELAKELQDLYEEYLLRRDTNPVPVLEQKLIILRHLLATGEESTSSDLVVLENDCHGRLKQDRHDCRQQLRREQQFNRDLIRKILKKWREIKQLREKYENNEKTSLKLIIKTENVMDNDEEDVKHWESQFNQDFNEIFDEQMELYNLEIKTNGLAKKPNPQEIEDQLQELFSKSIRHPGEPIIYLELLNLTSENYTNIEENSLAGAVTLLIQIIVDQKLVTSIKKINKNNQRIQLNELVSIEFTKKIPATLNILIFEEKRLRPLQKLANFIVPLPDHHELYEHASKINLKFTTSIDPTASTSSMERSNLTGEISLKIGWLDYCYDIEGDLTGVHCHHTHLNQRGNKNIKVKSTEITNWFDTNWLDPFDPEITSLTAKYTTNNTATTSKTTASTSNPKKSLLTSSETIFRLNEDRVAFCSAEEIDRNERFNLLKARYSRCDLHIKDTRLIPSKEREIPQTFSHHIIEDFSLMDPIDMQRYKGKKYLHHIYQLIENHCEILNRNADFQDLLIGDGVPTIWSFIETIINLFRISRPLNPQRRSRSPKSESKSHGTITGTGGGGGGTVTFYEPSNQYKIIINVIRAHGVPYRQPQQQQQQQHLSDISANKASRRASSIIASSVGAAGGSGGAVGLSSSQLPFNPKLSMVSPYAQVLFRDKSERTHTAEGFNPRWNETLILPVRPSLKHHQRRGRMDNETLSIQIFDECIEDLLNDDDRLKGTDIYQRISSKWLGEIRIPINTILVEQRLEGTFEMMTPIILPGYVKPSMNNSFETGVGIGGGAIRTSSAATTTSNTTNTATGFLDDIPEIKNSIYLTLFISVEPKFSIPTVKTNNLECTELDGVKNRVQLWQANLQEEFPYRIPVALVTLTNGKRVCITRLVGPIEIPFQHDQVAEYLIRRFVALIPVIQFNQFSTPLNGIWLTNDQTLTILSTTPKDLGTILTSFYLSLGYMAYLVLGSGILTGETTFVLTKEHGEYYLIDPGTGKRYSAQDTLCTLTKVYAVVNNFNVWANIQKETRVFMTRFDIEQSSDWRPLFNRSFTAPLGLVHDTKFEYKPSADTQNLRKIIEWKLMKKISVWREHRKTIWNRSLCEQMRQILIELEEDVCYEYEQQKLYIDKLTLSATNVFKMFGFPINLRYVNLSSIVERIKATGIHLNNDESVEFSIVVHIQPYPNNVLSVWIFLLSLVPKT